MFKPLNVKNKINFELSSFSVSESKKRKRNSSLFPANFQTSSFSKNEQAVAEGEGAWAGMP